MWLSWETTISLHSVQLKNVLTFSNSFNVIGTLCLPSHSSFVAHVWPTVPKARATPTNSNPHMLVQRSWRCARGIHCEYVHLQLSHVHPFVCCRKLATGSTHGFPSHLTPPIRNKGKWLARLFVGLTFRSALKVVWLSELGIPSPLRSPHCASHQTSVVLLHKYFLSSSLLLCPGLHFHCTKPARLPCAQAWKTYTCNGG